MPSPIAVAFRTVDPADAVEALAEATAARPAGSQDGAARLHAALLTSHRFRRTRNGGAASAAGRIAGGPAVPRNGRTGGPSGLRPRPLAGPGALAVGKRHSPRPRSRARDRSTASDGRPRGRVAEARADRTFGPVVAAKGRGARRRTVGTVDGGFGARGRRERVEPALRSARGEAGPRARAIRGIAAPAARGRRRR